MPPAAIDRWCQHAQKEVSHIAEASGFVNFELRYDVAEQRRVIWPQHYIITFATRDKVRSRHHNSLLTLRLVKDEELPEEVQVGVEVQDRNGDSVVCSGDHIEFELLSTTGDAQRQPALRVASGPVRVNSQTGQREFMRVDLGRCVRQISTDAVEDPRHRGQKLVRSRWWICLELLRLVCNANGLDSSVLDGGVASTPPLEWVICLVDEKCAACTGAAEQQEELSIDELAKYIDGDAKSAKREAAKGARPGAAATTASKAATSAPPKAPKSSAAAKVTAAGDRASSATAPSVAPVPQTAPALPTATAAAASAPLSSSAAETQRKHPGRKRGAVEAPPAATAVDPVSSSSAVVGDGGVRPLPPPGWSRTVDLASSLANGWRSAAGSEVKFVAEANGFVHFKLNYGSRPVLDPPHYVVAFPHLVCGHQQHPSALLKMSVVPGTSMPQEAQSSLRLAHLSLEGSVHGVGLLADLGKAAGHDSIEFELLARESEVVAQAALRFTAGPVRVNSQTGQRESMRLNLGDGVYWAAAETVDGIFDGEACRLVRKRWWIAMDTLRLVCAANSLDCSALSPRGSDTPLEWVACLVDDQTPPGSKEAPLPKASAATVPSSGRSVSKEEAPLPKASAAAVPSSGRSVSKEEDPPPTAAGEAVPSSGRSVSKEEEPKRPAGGGCSALNASIRPPLQSRALALPSALIDSWCQFAQKTVTHVAEATGFVHFELNFDAEAGRRTVSPECVIVAFPSRDRCKPRHQVALLSLSLVNESDVPPSHVAHCTESQAGRRPDGRGGLEYVEFELLLRVQDSPLVQQQLRISAGPVRVNPETGLRESMRIDLGRSVRDLVTDVVDDPRGKRVVRTQWWICVETLRLISTANALDCTGLDRPSKSGVEWVLCLVDERFTQEAQEGLPDEDKNIDDLVDFIDGKAEGFAAGKKKKKKGQKDLPQAKQEKGAAPSPLAAAPPQCLGRRLVADSLRPPLHGGHEDPFAEDLEDAAELGACRPAHRGLSASQAIAAALSQQVQKGSHQQEAALSRFAGLPQGTALAAE